MSRSIFRHRTGRVLHHLFGLGVVAAVVVTLVLGRQSAMFAHHDTLGLALAAMVVLRLLWALVVAANPRPASPGARVRSLGRTVSTIATWTVLAAVLGLAATGLLMNRGAVAVRPTHGVMAYALAAAALAHTALVVVHMARRRAALSASAGRTPPEGIERMAGQPR